MKRIFTLVPAALAISLTLAGCSTGTEAEPEADNEMLTSSGACLEPGAVSDSIELEGDFGGELKLLSATPVNATVPEKTVITPGDEALEPGEQYTVGITLFNGRSGETIEHGTITMGLGALYLDSGSDILDCSAIGERSIVTFPAASLYGEGQVESTGISGLEEDDSLVLALDFIEKLSSLDQATGKEIPLPDSSPIVEIADNGEPTITIPKGLEAPEELTVLQMVEGEGPKVTENDTVLVHYKGIIWRTGDEFDSSWSRSQPTEFPVNGVIGGFKDALVGYPVGSRLVSIVPAEDGGYGADALASMGHEEDDVMVFVLDILSAF